MKEREGGEHEVSMKEREGEQEISMKEREGGEQEVSMKERRRTRGQYKKVCVYVFVGGRGGGGLLEKNKSQCERERGQ